MNKRLSKSYSHQRIYLIFFCRAAKEQKRATKAVKKPAPAAKSKSAPKSKAQKVQPKSAPRVGGKR